MSLHSKKLSAIPLTLSVLILGPAAYNLYALFYISTPELWFTFFIIFTASAFSILCTRQSYSLDKMHWYFVYIFFFIAPSSQIAADYYPWNYRLSNELMIHANLLIILWIGVYTTTLLILKRLKRPTGHHKELHQLNLKIFEENSLIIGSIASVITMIALTGFRFSLKREDIQIGDGTFSILFTFLLRSIPVISCAIFLLLKKKQNNRPLAPILILFLCALYNNSPFETSRYWAGVVYLGLFICAIPRRWTSNRLFDFAILGVLTVLFPFFNLLKNKSLSHAFGPQSKLNILSPYNNVDFDAHSMMCRIVYFVDEFGHTLGEQFRSVIFFFIPRSIWNIKGVHSGQLVTEAQGGEFTNVSAPLPGEAYLDFGPVGLLIFAASTALLFRWIDSTYWCSSNDRHIRYIDIILPFLLGFVLFVMRGSLQSTFLRVMGFFLFLILIYGYKNIPTAIWRLRHK